MNYSPKDILKYVIDNEKEADFLVANAMHKRGYSIGEITDARFVCHEEGYYLRSKSYDINLLIEDEDIAGALKKDMLVSAFICRKDNSYQVRFLVHRFSKEEASSEANADEIARTVVQFMIIRTVIALRLDSPQKIDEYISVS